MRFGDHAKEGWGKRVRYACAIKTNQPQGTVGAWLGLEIKSNGKPLPINYMTTRKEPISGTTDWTKRAIVVSVPPGTDNLLIGIACNGRGLAFLNDVRLDEEFDQPRTTDLNDFRPGH